jgi:uroporphyrinogen decarboxylase
VAMTKRERVMGALQGKPVDRVPLGFWMHNFASENSAEGLCAESLRLAETFGWDYLKPQSRAQCFAEMWGLKYAPSDQRAVQYTVTHAPLATADDVRRLAPADPRGGALGEQLEALRGIRAAVGHDTPIIWTVFSPLMVLPFLLRGGRDQALAMVHDEPAAVEHGLDAMAETLAVYARACLAGGADGLFYATNVATRELLTAADCRRFQRPFDLRILAAAAAAPFNVMHVCGTGVHFDEFADYPVAAFSWATDPGNPSLHDGQRRIGRAVMGGLPAKAALASMTASSVAERARAAIAEMDGRWLLLGPDCSVNPDTRDELFHAVGAAVRAASTD